VNHWSDLQKPGQTNCLSFEQNSATETAWVAGDWFIDTRAGWVGGARGIDQVELR
jgi:hypothetical protein